MTEKQSKAYEYLERYYQATIKGVKEYRKGSVTIKAIQCTGENLKEVFDFVGRKPIGCDDNDAAIKEAFRKLHESMEQSIDLVRKVYDQREKEARNDQS